MEHRGALSGKTAARPAHTVAGMTSRDWLEEHKGVFLAEGSPLLESPAGANA